MPIVLLFQAGQTLDTAQGRASAFNWCNGTFEQTLPAADSTVDQFDRAHLWGLYTGIPVQFPPDDRGGMVPVWKRQWLVRSRYV